MEIKKHSHSITRNTSSGRSYPKYIVMHYTAGDGSTAKYNDDFFLFNSSWQAQNASADFFVDDNDIWQYNTQLDSRYSWAVGDGMAGTFGGKCTNLNQISVEMCCWYDRTNTGKWYINSKTYNNAVELVKYLMKKYNISVDRVIRHYDVSLKNCPGAYGWTKVTGDESTWKKFKSAISSITTNKPAESKPINTPIYRVRKSANDAKSQIGAYTVLSNAKRQADEHTGYNVYDGTGKLIYSPKSKKKTVDEVASEVIAGKWGNGTDRKNRLTAAGYDYNEIQAIVNKFLQR